MHCPLDQNSYKLSILKDAPRIAAVKIFKQERVLQTESKVRVLTADNSPNDIQNFTYDWIARTRGDGYWSSSLSPDNFLKGRYVVPPGSSYGGLNDCFRTDDFDSSVVVLSCLSLIPELNFSGFHQLNSERASVIHVRIHTYHIATTSPP
ncbi:hypothetical protein DCAR_0311429 [Daucus carota subsp. sativus]|uniref:DUF7796 domain-containing protein n=1 Tax=Daucus carota subsp. sativus TaxID=79200 RepID=A0AAF0WN41_DAUCS|nr:hypothetical protein DCAR_0311429 [Daucus carota subsp. sativus]